MEKHASMIHAHVLNRGGRGVQSPADKLGLEGETEGAGKAGEGP